MTQIPEQTVLDAIHLAVRELYNAAFQTTLDAFQCHALDAISSVIRFDSAMWMSGAHETNQLNSVYYYKREPIDVAHYLALLAETDLVRQRAAAEPGIPFRIEDATTLAEYRKSPIYLQAGRERGAEYAMGTTQFDRATRLSDYIVLYSADRKLPFSDEDREAKRLLVPHMVAAWRHSQMIGLFVSAKGLEKVQHDRALGRAVIDPLGLIQAADESFGHLLSNAFPNWRGPTIPDAVMAVLPEDSSVASIEGLSVSVERAGPRWIMTLSEIGPAQALTPAELRVVRLYTSGATDSKISDELGISRSTVRNHIASAYAKLGVNSKVLLARKIGQP